MTKQDTLILKGLGIIAMLSLHLFGYPFTKICVSIFVFASGFGLAAGFKKLQFSDTLNFMKKRIVKFYKSFWPIFIIFVSIGIFVFKRTPLIAYGGYGILRLILDFFCIGCYNYDVQWWFNTQILILYLLFPLFFFLVKHAPLSTLGGSLILTKFAIYDKFSVYFQQCPYMFQIYYLLMMAFVFISGIALSYHWDNITKTLSKFSYSYLLILLLEIFFIYAHTNSKIPFIHGWRAEGFILLCFALLIAKIPENIKKYLYVFELFGKHSGNIYYFHWFIVNWWLQDFFKNIKIPIISIGLALVLCLLISIFIEFLKKYIHPKRINS